MDKTFKKLKVDYEKARRDRKRLVDIKEKIKPISKILEQIKVEKIKE